MAFTNVSKSVDSPLDQSQTEIDFGTGTRFGDTTKVKGAQTFQPSVTKPLRSFVFKIIKTGSPTDAIKCEIYSESGGLPNTLLLTSNLINGPFISSGDFTTVEFIFPFSTPLTANTTYWAILSRTGSPDDSNRYFYAYGGGDGINRYSRGQTYYYDGASWNPNDFSTNTFDAYFKEYYSTNLAKSSNATFTNSSRTAQLLWASTTHPWQESRPWQIDGSGVAWATINKN